MEVEYVDALVCSKLNGSYEVKRVKLGEMRADEIIVRMVATGVCHTDFAITNGTTPAPLPIIGGHEGAGIVERIGSAITHVEVGDHVLLSYSFCGQCAPCKRGQVAYCFEIFPLNFGGQRIDGTKAFTLEDGQEVSSHFFGQSSFAHRSIVRGVSVVKIDKSLPLETLCPLGCSIQTGAGTVLNVLKPSPGSALAVFGVGSVGLSGIMAAALTSASKIIAVDIVDSKLELARQLGATHTINSKTTDVVREIRSLTSGYGVEGAFDATGNTKVIRDMIDCGAPNSIVATVGAAPMGKTVEIEPGSWLARGVNYRGVHQGSSTASEFIPTLIEYWKSGRFPIEKLLKTYRYDEIEKVREDLHAGRNVKAVLLWP